MIYPVLENILSDKKLSELALVGYPEFLHNWNNSLKMDNDTKKD